MRPPIGQLNGSTMNPDEIRRRRVKALSRHYGRRAGTDAFESALRSTCERMGISKAKGRRLVSCLVEEITNRLCLGEIVRIPRLVAMCVVPCSANKCFRLRCSADTGTRLRIREEVASGNGGTDDRFSKMCRTLGWTIPRYLGSVAIFVRRLKRGHRRIQRELSDERIFRHGEMFRAAEQSMQRRSVGGNK
jgi:hypothetical protein